MEELGIDNSWDWPSWKEKSGVLRGGGIWDSEKVNVKITEF